MRIWMLINLLWGSLLLGGCRALAAEPAAAIPPVSFTPTLTATAVSPSPSPSATFTKQPPPATPTAIPTSTATATPVNTPTATPIGLCSRRIPSDDDLFTLVSQTYNLSREYAPQDLILLTDYLPMTVTLGYPTEIRQVALQPLLALITDMQTAGLEPQIISGYRSYSAQAIAWEKWNRLEPERAAIVSARPGHSEHQLGTVVDFGSPSLADVTEIPDIEFHTYFFKTPEGIWLLENAHRYGFSLSYTREASEVTGFYYEPWHYRYVGPEMAAQLKELNLTLTEYQLLNQPEPCIPD